ncbi:MAG: lysozyme [Mesorhizobium sp.]|uniref:glycoside hydrolase family 25 protein n=1 Tax=unclassified Mesorhizobium TaxID=325217 RepID=UPI0008024F60|nr:MULTISPECIES: GH25 family lysozyme [unclassified Mesorhizobium]OBQ96355.1 lysozyme [Mesorhizobium sp. AA23]TIO72224.1 MAG: lysozyme [Mesorhizobium sp.]
MRNGLIALALAFVVLALATWAEGFFRPRAFPPDRSEFPIRGIDVSHHQGRIDWPRVAADDVVFAIIKATEGGDYVDDAFAENLRQARAAGLAVGAYHFFTFCRPGADQARNFISVVPRGEQLLPPVVDIEFHGNCPRRPSPAELNAQLLAFLGPVEAAYGKPAILYITDETAPTYAAHIAVRQRWLRSVRGPLNDDDWVYWQYLDTGRVDGIDGDVDLNVLKGGPARLSELFAAAPDPSSSGRLLSP